MFNYKLLTINCFQFSFPNSQFIKYTSDTAARGRGNEVFIPAPGLLTAMQAAVALVADMQESNAEACLNAPTGREDEVVAVRYPQPQKVALIP